MNKPLDGRCSVNHLQSFKASARILPIQCGQALVTDHEAPCSCVHGESQEPARSERSSKGLFVVCVQRIGPMLVPASDSGPGEKRYCCAVDETPHKWASKIAPIPRKAVGYTLVPHWTRIEGTLAKSGCH
jgi:hypothetical protein